MKKNYWILWILCAALLFSACSEGYEAVLSGSSVEDSSGGPDDVSVSDVQNTPDPGAPVRAVPLIWVYVCGAVNHPGVYQLAEGSRVCEALQCAGGLKEDADERSLNQAQVLEDGQQIIVLTVEETKNTGSGTAAGSGSGSNAGGSSGNAKVNINTAGREELMTLPGIGEARAEAIIAYREENGAFQSAEEIMKIEGIKEKSYAKLQDKICV